MTAPARDVIALYDAPDGELRRLWRGAGHVESTQHDSHVPDGRGGVLPITELGIEIRAEDDEVSHGELLEALRTDSLVGPHWIAWGESFVRVTRWENEWLRSGRTWTRIRCTTGRPCLATTSDGYLVTLRGETVAIALTEPSPPVPTDEWMPQQRRAASDRLIAAFGHACTPGPMSDTPEPRAALSP